MRKIERINYDNRILKLLARNGAMHAMSISQRFGLSYSTVYQMLERLVKQGTVWKDGTLYRRRYS
jgi:DNA-binding IclR family transcriptional regulator